MRSFIVIKLPLLLLLSLTALSGPREGSGRKGEGMVVQGAGSLCRGEGKRSRDEVVKAYQAPAGSAGEESRHMVDGVIQLY